MNRNNIIINEYNFLSLPHDVVQKIISFLESLDILYLRSTSFSTQKLIGFEDSSFILEKCIQPILSRLPKRCLGNKLRKSSNVAHRGFKKTRKLVNLTGTRNKIPPTTTSKQYCYFSFIIPKVTINDIVPEDVLTFRLWKKLNQCKGSVSSTTSSFLESEKQELTRHSCNQCSHLRFNNPSKYCYIEPSSSQKHLIQNIQEININKNMLSLLATELVVFFKKPSFLKKPKQRSKVQHVTNFLAHALHLKELFIFIKILLRT